MTRSRSRLKENAEVKFPVRVRIELPSEGRTQTYSRIDAWLTARYGQAGFARTSGIFPGQVNASLVYFPDAEGLSAFIETCGEVSFATDRDRSLFGSERASHTGPAKR